MTDTTAAASESNDTKSKCGRVSGSDRAAKRFMRDFSLGIYDYNERENDTTVFLIEESVSSQQGFQYASIVAEVLLLVVVPQL